MSSTKESDTMASDGTSDAHINGHSLPYMFSMEATEAFLSKPIDAEVKGHIPGWLKGSLYRNGSGVYKMGDDVWKHLFDGFSVIHRWTIQDGKVTYLSTALDSDDFNRCFAANRIMGFGFGTHFPDPCKSIFRRFFSHFLPIPPGKPDNTAVNIVEMGDRLFAMTETTILHEVNPETLLSDGKVDIGEQVALHLGTAHPHFENDGTVLYYGTNFNYRKAYNIVRATPPKDNNASIHDAKIIACLPSRWKLNIGYTHSFGISENYIIILELPVTLNLWKLLTSRRRLASVVDCMEFFPDEKILIHVVEKETGRRMPYAYQAPHGFVFHFINCFEEDGYLVVDLCLIDNSEIVKKFYMNPFVNDDFNTVNAANFARFVLPLDVKEAQIGDPVNHLEGSEAKAVLSSNNIIEVDADRIFGYNVHFDLPRINYESINTKKYRYIYGTGNVDNDPIKKVIKLDIETKKTKFWNCPSQNYMVAEPVFVQQPGTTEEDEGVVLCPIVSNSSELHSFLVILDASTFQELATASIPVDIKMNFSFHGTFTSKPV